MTSMPASRNARAMIFAPRSCPSRPGLATTTRILPFDAASTAGADATGRALFREFDVEGMLARIAELQREPATRARPARVGLPAEDVLPDLGVVLKLRRPVG